MLQFESNDAPRRTLLRLAHRVPLRRLLEEAVALAFAVPPEAMRARSRGAADIAFARQSAMYLAHVMLGLSYSEVGRLFRRDRTTARYACQLVEDRRDDPTIDRKLDTIEQVCGELFCAPSRAVLQ